MQSKPSPNVLRFIIFLTVLFVIAQIICVSLYQQFNLLPPVTRYALSLPSLLNYTSLQPLGLFLLTQLGLYVIYVFLIWHMSISITQVLHLSDVAAKLIAFFLWLNSIISLVLLNAYLIPHSFFAHLVLNEVQGKVWLVALVISLVINAIALVISYAQSALDVIRGKNLKYQSVLFVLTAFVVAATLHIFTKTPHKQFAATNVEHPNIFIIGFDGLRPDFLSFFNHDVVATPNFDEFLQTAVIFSRNYTPLAHTAPAWASILTGLYPLHHKIREDQTLIDLIKIENALPRQLQKAGYYTVFATDDRNYNNIDERFGFNKVIGPTANASNFILTTINDFPLSNLIAISPLGKYVFPYNYINRSAANIYNPQNFIKEIEGNIISSPNKPLFLSVHLNLSAAPYYWFKDKMPLGASKMDLYHNAILKEDMLLSELLTLLQKNHYLDHALVFITSDHGITQQQSNNLLNLKKNLNLLALKGFGVDIKPHVVTARTSLIDVAPTILDLVNIERNKNFDGISLKSAIINSETLADRPLYFETGMQQTDKNLILQNSYYYITAHNGVIAIYPPLLKLLATNKQHGILQGDWLLIYFPKNNILKAKHGFVLLNVKSGRWTTELNSFSKDAPMEQLKQNLEDFYGNEIPSRI